VDEPELVERCAVVLSVSDGADFALMLGKTLLVAATGALVFRRCRLRDHPWIGFFLCSCAAVALGPWLFLRPILFSYFFLALVMVLLDRLPAVATWQAACRCWSCAPFGPTATNGCCSVPW